MRVHRLRRLYVPSFRSSIDGMTTPAWIDSTTWIMSGACVAISPVDLTTKQRINMLVADGLAGR